MKSLMAWRTPGEVARAAGFLAALQAVVLLVMIAGTNGFFFKIAPNTVDFASFYAAGQLANAGTPQAAYDERALRRAEEAAREPGINYQYFFNPPPFLLIMAPLARLPYLVAFCLFELVTLVAWLVVGTRTAGGGHAATLALLAVPSLWWVLGLGQNAFLSAALMGSGMLLLPTRPFLAGLAFGALSYKPHLGLMIPVALLAGGEWRAIAGAGLALLAEIGLSLALFGRDSWRAFFAMAQRSVGGAIDTGQVKLSARVDPTGALQLMGLNPAAARAGWIVLLAASVLAVIWLWRRGSREERAAGLAASVLVAAPFALFYDLVMASLAAAWLARAARCSVFLAGEKQLLALLVLLTLFAAPEFAAKLHVPFGAASGPVLLMLIVRRNLKLSHL